MKSCCCGTASLQTGSKIICYIILIVGLAGCIVFSVNIYDKPKYRGEDFFDGPLGIAMCAIGAVLALAAIVDITKNRSHAALAIIGWIIPYIIFNILGLICAIIWGLSGKGNNARDDIFSFDTDGSNSKKTNALVILIIHAVLIITHVYFALVLGSYYDNSIL